jgi:hypothetical protein
MPRLIVAFLLTSLAAIPLYSFWLRHLVLVGLPRDAFIGLGIVLSVSLVAVIAVGSLRRRTTLHRLDVRQLRTPAGRRSLLVWAICGFAVGLAAGAAVGLSGGFANVNAAQPHIEGLRAGLLFGLLEGAILATILGLSAGLRARPDTINKPRQLVRQGLAYTAVQCSVGLAVAVPLTLVTEPRKALVFGLLCSLAAISTSPWPRYGAACAVLAGRQRTPLRLARFLDWAYDAGLLRLSGAAVQFRHREFQLWLTRVP